MATLAALSAVPVSPSVRHAGAPVDGPGAYEEDFEIPADGDVENDNVEEDYSSDEGGGNEEDNAVDCLEFQCHLSKGAFPWSALAPPCFNVAWYVSHLTLVHHSLSIIKNFIDMLVMLDLSLLMPRQLSHPLILLILKS